MIRIGLILLFLEKNFTADWTSVRAIVKINNIQKNVNNVSDALR